MRNEIPHEEHRFLPQVGFGQDITFDAITYNKFLFRVYTPKKAVSTDEDSAFFVGSKFDQKYAPSTPISSDMYLPFGSSLAETATYEDCINHLSWETRSSSPFISTSCSFAWAIWDAVRRYNSGVKHDVEIAVINAAAVAGKAVTALQLLKKGNGHTLHEKHSRWQRFAQESQSVLVYGFIPRSAVLASVPLLSVLDRLPSYFTKPSSSEVPLRILSWNFDSPQSTYRKFCQEMADRFLRLPFQTRARDTAVGSVRLAISLLDPWFYDMVHEDLHKAVAKTRDLACVIAHWPEQSGSTESNEMGVLIRAPIYLLAEEVRAKHTCKMEAELTRLQGVIDQLEVTLHDQEKLLPVRFDEHAQHDEPEILEPNQEEMTPIPILETTDIFPTSPRRRSLKITIPSSSSGTSSSSGSSPISPVTPSSFSTPPSLPTTPYKSRFPLTPIVNHPPSPEFSSASTTSSPPRSPLLLPSTHLASPLTPITLPQPHSPSIYGSDISRPASSSSSSSSASSAEAGTSGSHRERPTLITTFLPVPLTSTMASPSAYLTALPSLPEDLELDTPMSEGCRAIMGDLQMFLPRRNPLVGGLGSVADPCLPLVPLPGVSEVDLKGKGKARLIENVEENGTDNSDDQEVGTTEEADEEFEELSLADSDDLKILGHSQVLEAPEFLWPSAPYSKTRSVVSESVSCVVSGFLIGAFITLCIISSQRRALLTNLT
ncbi:hypothetical protein D9758_010056 [Tetrapyrgos nigripes]|uniref:DUF7587 domain-containing protein n=1 Tax=Tetrapyrgos nigripes TaxID=182062 RepID=A0A8H5CU31_9AGAR|nr:hypothetical protein D9758_010056 [Tetrapyrgos nigripes]